LAAVATMLALLVGLLMIADAGPTEPDQPVLETTVASSVQSTVPVAPVASVAPTTALVSTAAPTEPDNATQGNGHGHAKKKPHPDKHG
jgi:hypothetical protein